MDNATIARALYDLADCLEIEGEAPFRLRAFRGAGKAIEELTEPASVLLERGSLTDIRGVGAGVARRVEELIAHGDLAELAERRGQLPPGLRELVQLPGVGLKTAELIWRKLGVGDVDELEAAARAGKLSALPRFGKAKEDKLIAAVEVYRKRQSEPSRWTADRALRVANRVVEHLRRCDGVLDIQYAGSLRRGAETIGDIDILIAAAPEDATRIMTWFSEMAEVAEILVGGDKKTSVRLHEGIQVDLRVLAADSWGAALQYFTGSKEHNVEVRALAVRKGLKVNEYGVFDADDNKVAGATEEDVYASVGLSWIEPQLREARGEIAAAQAGTLPKLIERADLRGDMHMHTKESDGRATLREMADAAMAAGLSYVAITDHSETLTLARGLTSERLDKQAIEIAALNEELEGRLSLLRGVEADILADGTVDLGNDYLRSLDWVVGSIHGQFRMSRAEQTARMIKAIESDVVDCIGHPTGRMLGKRPGYEIDLEAVLVAAKKMGVALELNCSPNRLDLDEHALRMAKEAGVMIVLSSDAHNPRQLGFLEHGSHIARRAWLESKHVANTLPLDQLRQHFAHHHVN